MKSLILKLIVGIALITPYSAFGIEYLWTDKKGNRHFDCGGFVVGGKAVIKDLGWGKYRVRGVLIDREINANSIYHAAQIGCGERDEFEAPKTPAENSNK